MASAEFDGYVTRIASEALTGPTSYVLLEVVLVQLQLDPAVHSCLAPDDSIQVQVRIAGVDLDFHVDITLASRLMLRLGKPVVSAVAAGKTLVIRQQPSIGTDLRSASVHVSAASSGAPLGVGSLPINTRSEGVQASQCDVFTLAGARLCSCTWAVSSRPVPPELSGVAEQQLLVAAGGSAGGLSARVLTPASKPSASHSSHTSGSATALGESSSLRHGAAGTTAVHGGGPVSAMHVAHPSLMSSSAHAAHAATAVGSGAVPLQASPAQPSGVVTTSGAAPLGATGGYRYDGPGTDQWPNPPLLQYAKLPATMATSPASVAAAPPALGSSSAIIGSRAGTGTGAGTGPSIAPSTQGSSFITGRRTASVFGASASGARSDLLRLDAALTDILNDVMETTGTGTGNEAGVHVPDSPRSAFGGGDSASASASGGTSTVAGGGQPTTTGGDCACVDADRLRLVGRLLPCLYDWLVNDSTANARLQWTQGGEGSREHGDTKRIGRRGHGPHVHAHDAPQSIPTPVPQAAPAPTVEDAPPRSPPQPAVAPPTPVPVPVVPLSASLRARIAARDEERRLAQSRRLPPAAYLNATTGTGTGSGSSTLMHPTGASHSAVASADGAVLSEHHHDRRAELDRSLTSSLPAPIAQSAQSAPLSGVAGLAERASMRLSGSMTMPMQMTASATGSALRSSDRSFTASATATASASTSLNSSMHRFDAALPQAAATSSGPQRGYASLRDRLVATMAAAATGTGPAPTAASLPGHVSAPPSAAGMGVGSSGGTASGTDARAELPVAAAGSLRSSGSASLNQSGSTGTGTGNATWQDVSGISGASNRSAVSTGNATAVLDDTGTGTHVRSPDGTTLATMLSTTTTTGTGTGGLEAAADLGASIRLSAAFAGQFLPPSDRLGTLREVDESAASTSASGSLAATTTSVSSVSSQPTATEATGNTPNPISAVVGGGGSSSSGTYQADDRNGTPAASPSSASAAPSSAVAPPMPVPTAGAAGEKREPMLAVATASATAPATSGSSSATAVQGGGSSAQVQSRAEADKSAGDRDAGSTGSASLAADATATSATSSVSQHSSDYYAADFEAEGEGDVSAGDAQDLARASDGSSHPPLYRSTSIR